MTLHTWAARWGISSAAVADLMREFGMDRTLQEIPQGHQMALRYNPPANEAEAQTAIRLEATRLGLLIWRNNVGSLEDKNGRHVRFGLANDSRQVNERIKSADLIGVRPIVIGPQHVGHVIGQFVSREVKAPGWHYAASPREQAQLRWIELLASVGADAKFATGEGTL